MEELFRNLLFQLARIGISLNTLILIIVGIVVIIIVKRSVSKKSTAERTESAPMTLPSSSSGPTAMDSDSMVENILSYCQSANWDHARTENMITVTFSMSDDRSQAVFITCFDAVIEIVGMIPISYGDMGDAPHDLSNTLMEMNAKRKVGFWAIKDVEENHYYCLMVNLRYSQAGRDAVINHVKTVRDGCDGMIDALLKTAAELS